MFAKRISFVIMALIALATLFALNAFSYAKEREPIRRKPLIGLTQEQIEQYTIQYAKSTFGESAELVAVKVANINGLDLQKVGVMPWDGSQRFILVVLKGHFDATSLWPHANPNIEYIAFGFEPEGGGAAYISSSPQNINILLDESLVPELPTKEYVPPKDMPTAVPDNSPIVPDPNADDLVNP